MGARLRYHREVPDKPVTNRHETALLQDLPEISTQGRRKQQAREKVGILGNRMTVNDQQEILLARSGRVLVFAAQ